MKEIIILRAWELNISRFSEPWFVPETIVYSMSRNEAKKLLLSELKYQDLALSHNNAEVTYINIPIQRNKKYDKVEFEGDIITIKSRNQILELRKRREFYNTLIQKNPDGLVYIRKGDRYYRSNCQGYTSTIIQAGIYTIQRGVQEILGSSIDDNMQAILIDKDKHNALIQEQIEELKQKLL